MWVFEKRTEEQFEGGNRNPTNTCGGSSEAGVPSVVSPRSHIPRRNTRWYRAPSSEERSSVSFIEGPTHVSILETPGMGGGGCGEG